MDSRIADLSERLTRAREEGRALLLTGLRVHVGDGSPARDLPVCIHDGRFAAAGAAESLDLKGWTLLPGLCDAHLHLFHEARRGLRVDLAGLKRRGDLWRRLASGVAEGPLMAGGWDESDWDDRRFPTRAELDDRFPDRPVGLVRVCGHAAVANSRALDEIDPAAGPVDRASGLLLEGAAVALGRRFPPDFDRLIAELGRVADGFAATGMTAVTEMGALNLPRLAAALPDDFPLRVEYYHAGPQSELPARESRGPARPLGRKFFLDGSIGGRSAAVSAPYVDGGRGDLLFTDSRLREELDETLAAGWNVALHAIGERAFDQALKLLGELSPSPGRARIEHAEMTDPARLECAAAQGLVLCLQPNFMDRWGRAGGLYETAFGIGFGERFTRPGDCRAAGLTLAYGTDGMPARLWPALAAAVSTDLFADGADRPEAALAAVSGDAAVAAGRGEVWGRVMEGLDADFCLVQSDPCAEDFREEPEPALTVRGGCPTWLHPQHQGR